MSRPVRLVAVALVLCLISTVPAAAQSTGTFALITDIHFNPFEPPELADQLVASSVDDWPAIFATISEQQMATWGSDTNYALLDSSVEAFAKAAAEADFVIVSGDLLAHQFQAKAVTALDLSSTDEKVDAMAVKTTIFVADRIAAALPGNPIILALGNNDSECGDCKIKPDGSYLAATTGTLRRLAGPDLVAEDFDETYGAGGYYAVRHPQHADTLILVINDVLWSAKYNDACGSGGGDAATAMMNWLEARLARQREAGGWIWLVHHIPWGIDSFSTVHSKAGACADEVVPFLHNSYSEEYIALMREFQDIIQASFAGHVHTDDYRLLTGDDGRPLDIQKIAPAISPIYQQNPGFEVVAYDRRTGLPTDFSATYIANLDDASLAVPGDWRFEYTYTKAYRLPDFTAVSLAALTKKVAAGGEIADQYRGYYYVSHNPLPAEDLPAYLCTIDHLDQAGFTKFYCGG